MSTENAPGTDTALPYKRWTRYVDRMHGRRSGRHRIPSFTGLMAHVDTGAPITAPYSEKLSAAGLVAMNDERLAFERQVAGTLQTIITMRHELAAAGTRLKRGAADIEKAKQPVTEEELLPRNPTEMTLDPEMIRNRRNGMRDKRIAAAEAEYERRIRVIDDLNVRIAGAHQVIEREFRAAQIRVFRLAEHYALRAATFWEAVTLTHPEGRQLALLLPRIGRELPPWIVQESVQVVTQLLRAQEIEGTGDEAAA